MSLPDALQTPVKSTRRYRRALPVLVEKSLPSSSSPVAAACRQRTSAEDVSSFSDLRWLLQRAGVICDSLDEDTRVARCEEPRDHQPRNPLPTSCSDEGRQDATPSKAAGLPEHFATHHPAMRLRQRLTRRTQKQAVSRLPETLLGVEKPPDLNFTWAGSRLPETLMRVEKPPDLTDVEDRRRASAAAVVPAVSSKPAASGGSAHAAYPERRKNTPPTCSAEAPTAILNQSLNAVPSTTGGRTLRSGCHVYMELAQGSSFLVKAREDAAALRGVLRAIPEACGGSWVESSGVGCWSFPVESMTVVLAELRRESRFTVEPLPYWMTTALQRSRQQAERYESEADALLEKHLRLLPTSMKEEKPVMDFQKDGIKFGISRGGRCLLGDEMGLGKTLQALSIAAQYSSEWPVLVVVPSTLRLVWRDQALSWLPHLLEPDAVQVITTGKDHKKDDAKLVIVSYDLLARQETFGFRCNGQPYQVLILDESHFIKDPNSKRAKTVLQVAKRSTRCILISGTPTVNKAAEIYTQLQALMPAPLPTYEGFCERYCYKQEQRFGGRTSIRWVGAKRKAELHAFLLNTVMIRRRKCDVLTQLPRKRRHQITLDSSKLRKDCLKELQKLKLSTQARAIRASYAHSAVPADVMKSFQLTAEAKVEAVAEYVEYLLSNQTKFLLFAHHRVMLDGLEAKLQALQCKYIRIDGETRQNARDALVTRFQSDASTVVALLSITTCGQGLTLTAASTVVFAELFWVPGQLLQAEDRVHRIGQERPVDIHFCIAEETLDKKVFEALDKKTLDTTGVLDGVSRERKMDIGAKCGPLPGRPEQVVVAAEERAAAAAAASCEKVASALPAASALASAESRRVSRQGGGAERSAPFAKRPLGAGEGPLAKRSKTEEPDEFFV
eukprot:TRINITY_DN19924_c0_g2_i1.p1 TRINITY_DN19924_c0_g2~~TRINITY_DN19924_c0_g2_i1.p1  ORF type:complete len:917 (-),score=199.05 TRINITY_DN19924_c0_g2_i1:119-2812(-)